MSSLDAYPYWFSAVTLKRDDVIDFYQWVVEERAWQGRVSMQGWQEQEYRSAIGVWRNRSPIVTGVLEIHFRNEADAVAFKLRYPDADYHGQEDTIKASA